MTRKGLQINLGRLSCAMNKFLWHPDLSVEEDSPQVTEAEDLFPAEETGDNSSHKRWQEVQAPGGTAGMEQKEDGDSGKNIYSAASPAQHRASLRRAVVMSEIIGEPVCRKRKRKAYGNQGNGSRG